MADLLLERFRRGDRLALARLLSLAARGERLDPRLFERDSAGPARVVAFTGSGGVGKSTLIGKLIERIRKDGLSVAVLACDPQSPLTGGALLGDRFRMPDRSQDEGVFIRSLAAASGHGAVAEHLEPMLCLLKSFGFDVILIETVGAGQGDTAVRELSDVLVLLLQPATGDDLQWEKAGVTEVADLVVVHKADLPQAEQVEAEVRAMLALSPASKTPVIRVSSKTGEGLEAVWTALKEMPPKAPTGVETGQDLLRLAQDAIARWFHRARTEPITGLPVLVAGWQEGKLRDAEAVSQLLELFRASRSK